MDNYCSIYQQVTEKFELINQMIQISPIIVSTCNESDLEKCIKKFIPIINFNFTQKFSESIPTGRVLSPNKETVHNYDKLYVFVSLALLEYAQNNPRFNSQSSGKSDNKVQETLLHVLKQFLIYQTTYQFFCKPDRDSIHLMCKNPRFTRFRKFENEYEFKAYADHVFDLLTDFPQGYLTRVNATIEKFCLIISTEYSNFQKISPKLSIISSPQSNTVISLSDVQNMTNYTFERYLHTLFGKMGYNVIQTKKRGDLGCDLIISNDTLKIAIQAKIHKSHIENADIQEIRSAMDYYKAQKGIVISTSDFTLPTKELANRNKVDLINWFEFSKIMLFFPVKQHELQVHIQSNK